MSRRSFSNPMPENQRRFSIPYFTINVEHREVKILAIWHGARNPAELRRRLK
jgi:hypothetical protein